MSKEAPANHGYDSTEEPSVVVDNAEPSSNIASNSDVDALSANEKPEPTTANDDDAGNTINNGSESSLANGLSSVISSIIRDFDSRAEATVRSQDQLSYAIDRLTRELDQLLEDAPLPFILQHAAKISGVRNRVSSLNSVLKSIQRRVDNIDRMLSAGLLQDKMTRKNAGQH
ncbi:unnamed protein product [Ilex paraguariensis]|uniref:Biogenesis of lysosome-related organelles complex 1 subunit 7 n=1 Tax=Ilex paraguariensis TaxID=185542 RepID=A0ABC8SKS5_9AQUA